MAAANKTHSALGSHPLTGQLVCHLRHSRDGLVFTDPDLDMFRRLGEGLGPESLHTWLRDLWVLVVTLRNDVLADIAACQIEAGLIDPLCLQLDAMLRRPAYHDTGSEAVLH
jgi:hypothetical protein